MRLLGILCAVRATLLFAAAAILWGVPYLLIELTEGEVPPAFLVFARSGLGACVLLPFVLHDAGLRALRGRGRKLLVLALLDLAAPAFVITVGLTHVASSLAGTLVASVPIIVALLAFRYEPAERVTGFRLVGLSVGIGGVALLLGVDLAGDLQTLLGGVLVLAGAACYATGALYYQRHFADLPPLVVVVGTLVGCSVLSAVPAAFQAPQGLPSATALIALLVIGAGCTGLGYTAFYTLVADFGAGRASIVTYLAPVVAVLSGVIVLDEPLTMSIVAGLVLVLTGAWLASSRRPPPAPVGGHLGSVDR